MSHGLPDFYRGVDIAYQALSEMIARPKYGVAHGIQGQVKVTKNAETTLVTVSGKGMLYGGFVWLDHDASQKACRVNIYTDGNRLTYRMFWELEKYNLIAEHAPVAYLLKCDETEFIYCVGLSYGYTFEESLVVKYSEEAGGTPMVLCELAFALV